MVLQIWCGLVLPTITVVAADNLSYREYRYERLHSLLLHQRRQLRASQRRWARSASVQRQEQANTAGIPSSDLSSSPGSGPSSSEAEAEAQTVAAQAAALLDAPAIHGLLHPGDWQWEAAHQALTALRRLGGWAALLLGAAACMLYAWHVLAFGGD